MHEPPDGFIDVLSDTWLQHFHQEAQKPPDAVETPWPTWNQACRDAGGGRGPAHGWQVVIAGMTGEGKTILSLNWAWECVRRGESVAFFTGEMTPNQLLDRFLAIATGSRIHDLERGNLDLGVRKEANRMVRTLRTQGGGALYVNQVGIGGMHAIEAAMDRFESSAEHVRTFMFDYIQLFAQDATDDSWYKEVTSISRRIQQFSHERSVLSVELSQFSRGQNVRERPTIFNLKHSSNLEQDADQVLLLDHVMQHYNRPTRERFQWLSLAKNRHGPNVMIPVVWDYSTLRCRELQIADGEQIPHWVPDNVRRAAA